MKRAESLTEYNAEWQRLYKVITWTGMNTNRFALHIGLPAAENLYRIKRGQNGISRSLAERIFEHYPRISRGWLLFGEGRMLLDEGE